MPVNNYIWDEHSDNVRLEIDDTGTVIAEYMNEPGQFGNLISQRRDGTNSFFHFDAQGSTRQLTTDAEFVSDTYSYTAFGEPVASTGTTTNPFRYNGAVGYHTGVETGDVYVRRRTYNTSLARWYSIDPISFADGPNRYLYTRNRFQIPDPSGLFAVSPKNRRGKAFGKVCAFYMWDHYGEKGQIHPKNRDWSRRGGWVDEAKSVGDVCLDRPVDNIGDIVREVINNECCTIYLIGHRGGEIPNTGVTTYPEEDLSNGKIGVPILPNQELEQYLSLIFLVFKSIGKCCDCAINIVACAKDDWEHRQTRRKIAKNTNCWVCQSRNSQNCGFLIRESDVGKKGVLRGVTLVDPPHDKRLDLWDPDCVSPTPSPSGVTVMDI